MLENFLFFYARKEQEVELTILAHAVANPQAKFRIILDHRTWGNPRKFPTTLVQGNITSLLSFDTEPAANLHVLKFLPVNFKEKDRAVIQCVVLVRNPNA